MGRVDTEPNLSMQKNIYLPPLEAGFENTMVLQWLVEVGDFVAADQALLEIETQKTVSEVPSTHAGYVRKLCVEQNDTITENALLVILADSMDEALQEPGTPARSAEVTVQDASPASLEEPATKALPAVRKLARELNVDLAAVRGTGSQGQITLGDVKAAASPSHGPSPSNKEETQGGWLELPAYRISLNLQMQKSLAEIPQIHISRQMDVTALMTKVEGVTFTHKLIQKVALALELHPALRTTIQGNKIKVQPVSVAVAIENSHGLVAPVVRAPQTLTLVQIAEKVRDLRQRAENRALQGEEFKAGPFALTNLGMQGVDFFSAFVFHGQTAVLSVGRVTDIGAARSAAWFNLAVDHRVVDGAEAARFLATLQNQFSISL